MRLFLYNLSSNEYMKNKKKINLIYFKKFYAMQISKTEN